MSKRAIAVAVPGLIVLFTGAAVGAGGWAVVTLETLPDHGLTAQPMVLDFTIRQHGVAPLEGLRPRVEARSGGREVTVPAASGSRPGRYSAALTLPSPGDWTVTIHTGFGANRSVLLPIEVVDKAPARPVTEPDRGKRLFVAKGCASCHLHREVAATVLADVGPDLTNRRYQLDYLKRYLANPAIMASRTADSKMPNLGLKPAEIGALAAFINAERQTVTGH